MILLCTMSGISKTNINTGFRAVMNISSEHNKADKNKLIYRKTEVTFFGKMSIKSKFVTPLNYIFRLIIVYNV